MEPHAPCGIGLHIPYTQPLSEYSQYSAMPGPSSSLLPLHRSMKDPLDMSLLGPFWKELCSIPPALLNLLQHWQTGHRDKQERVYGTADTSLPQAGPPPHQGTPD
jgi:hypothetical protein